LRERLDRAKVIAFVGIDGAGKSTVHRILRRRYESDAVKFVAKRNRSCVNSVLISSKQVAMENNYCDGEFADAIRWAHAFDFLRFFEEEVESCLDTARIIVSDRWTVCSEAYANMVDGRSEQITATLSVVPPADCLVRFIVDPIVSMARIAKEREPEGDETLELLRAYEKGYDAVLASCPRTVINVVSGELSSLVASVESILLDFVSTQSSAPEA
jgi:thymidylate kinase